MKIVSKLLILMIFVDRFEFVSSNSNHFRLVSHRLLRNDKNELKETQNTKRIAQKTQKSTIMERILRKSSGHRSYDSDRYHNGKKIRGPVTISDTEITKKNERNKDRNLGANDGAVVMLILFAIFGIIWLIINYVSISHFYTF